MNTDNIKINLLNLISKLFIEEGIDTDLIEHTDFFSDLGIDSLLFISMVVEIETFFSLEIPDDLLLIDNFRTFDMIVKIVENEMTQ